MYDFLHSHPHFLEVVYDLALKAVSPLRPWMTPGGFMERLFIVLEKATKGPMFHCHMCGQCVLHSTGMMCPMECPKNLRDGPCGGVRPNGHCEVKPEMKCVWVRAWESAQKMPVYGHELLLIMPPHNWQLQDSSSWINMMTGIDMEHPKGWQDVDVQMALQDYFIASQGKDS